jgi:hypothetical protein
LFISLDATLKRIHKQDKPGKIDNSEIEQIITQIRKIATANIYKLILIGSHYPLEYVECPDVPEENDWYEKHFWKSGEHLKRRINSVLKGVKVLWLSGDIHSPSFVQKDNNLYIVSGRFGTSDELFNKNAKDLITVEKISYINRQGTLIQINSDHTANIQIINQVQKTAGYDSNYIQWRATEIDEFSLLQNQPELISEKLDKILYGAILQKNCLTMKKLLWTISIIKFRLVG